MTLTGTMSVPVRPPVAAHHTPPPSLQPHMQRYYVITSLRHFIDRRMILQPSLQFCQAPQCGLVVPCALRRMSRSCHICNGFQSA